MPGLIKDAAIAPGDMQLNPDCRRSAVRPCLLLCPRRPVMASLAVLASSPEDVPCHLLALAFEHHVWAVYRVVRSDICVVRGCCHMRARRRSRRDLRTCAGARAVSAEHLCGRDVGCALWAARFVRLVRRRAPSTRPAASLAGRVGYPVSRVRSVGRSARSQGEPLHVLPDAVARENARAQSSVLVTATACRGLIRTAAASPHAMRMLARMRWKSLGV